MKHSDRSHRRDKTIEPACWSPVWSRSLIQGIDKVEDYLYQAIGVMRIMSKPCRWCTLIAFVLTVGCYMYLYKMKVTKPVPVSIIESFVFTTEVSRDKQTQVDDVITWQSINKPGAKLNLEFVEFTGDNNPRTKRPLPSARSHVTTNSSHVIALFVRDIGCTKNKNIYGLIYQYIKLVILCSHKTKESTCHSWVWDPANWTMILSDNHEHTNIYGAHRICAYPIFTQRVDKIVYPNGTEDLPGCTFNRTPCSVMEPYFDKLLNMRINWSPCCQRTMLKMLNTAHDVFENNHVRYVMIGGAVISVARENGTFIPYDTDLDLMIDIRDREKFRNDTAVDMAVFGYFYVWDKRGSYVRICATTVCDAHIDVWFYERYPNNKRMIKYFKMSFWSIREAALFPTSLQFFEGKKYHFPRKILKYLNHEYSSGVMAGYRNWERVLLCVHKRGRKCTFYSDKTDPVKPA